MRLVTVVCLLVLVVGVVCYCGCAPKPVAPPTAGAPAPAGAALGESICKTGIGASGQHLAFTGGSDRFKQEPGGCLGCHAEDGRGRTLPKGKIPAINYTALRGGAKPLYASDDAVVATVRGGTNSLGRVLSSMMPRWTLTDPEGGALVEYLKVLDQAPPAAKPAGEPAKPAAKAAPSKG